MTLSVFRLPYGLLIGVLIAFTALIPMFGAFIGCAIGAFLMLMVKPLDAVIFLIIFFCASAGGRKLYLSSCSGELCGTSFHLGSGCRHHWSSAMGIVGMLVFIPLCSVVYAILRGIVNERLEKKKRPKAKHNKVQ